MEDLIGKKIKYKGSDEIKIIKEVKNNRVYFTDNGSADYSKLFDSFELMKEPKLNPDTFFNDGAFVSNLGNILSTQFDQFQKNPEEYAKAVMSEPTYEVRPKIVAGSDISMLAPDTQRQILERIEMDKKLAKERDLANKNDPFMQQFNKNNNTNDDDEPNSESNRPTLRCSSVHPRLLRGNIITTTRII